MSGNKKRGPPEKPRLKRRQISKDLQLQGKEHIVQAQSDEIKLLRQILALYDYGKNEQAQKLLAKLRRKKPGQYKGLPGWWLKAIDRGILSPNLIRDTLILFLERRNLGQETTPNFVGCKKIADVMGWHWRYPDKSEENIMTFHLPLYYIPDYFRVRQILEVQKRAGQKRLQALAEAKLIDITKVQYKKPHIYTIGHWARYYEYGIEKYKPVFNWRDGTGSKERQKIVIQQLNQFKLSR